jgi:hypothetical protein
MLATSSPMRRAELASRNNAGKLERWFRFQRRVLDHRSAVVVDVTAARLGPFSAMNLSDVFEHLAPPRSGEHTQRPRAVVAAARRSPPDRYRNPLRVDEALSAALCLSVPLVTAAALPGIAWHSAPPEGQRAIAPEGL